MIEAMTYIESDRRVAIDGNFNGLLCRCCAATNLGHTAEDRGVEIACATLFANTNRHIFENDEVPLVPQRLAIDPALMDRTFTVFTV